MPDPFTSGTVGSVPYIAFTEDEMKDRVVAAAVAFVEACYVYGDDGEFQIQAHMAADEGRTLWNLIDIWKLIHIGDAESEGNAYA